MPPTMEEINRRNWEGIELGFAWVIARYLNRIRDLEEISRRAPSPRHRLVEGLVVYPESMKRNLDRTGGLWASEAVLLALVESGSPRQEAYVWVQRNAMRAWRGEVTKARAVNSGCRM